MLNAFTAARINAGLNDGWFDEFRAARIARAIAIRIGATQFSRRLSENNGTSQKKRVNISDARSTTSRCIKEIPSYLLHLPHATKLFSGINASLVKTRRLEQVKYKLDVKYNLFRLSSLKKVINAIWNGQIN